MKAKWIISLGLLVFLAACAPLQEAGQQATGLPPVSIQVTPAPTIAPAQPTAAPTVVQPEPTSQPEPFTGNVKVAVDGLNLRLGPGMNYAVARLLPAGEALQATGRSVSGKWIEVHTASGTGGWVYADYLDTSVSLADLPVKEAYGGPEIQPTPATTYGLAMTISDNVATVSVQRFPANTQIVARLAPQGGGEGLEVASAMTDANGVAWMSFEMPAYWADGSAVTQNRLTLTAGTADGSFSRSASIVYEH